MHDTDKTLMINEIFYSIQGESTWSGVPCIFVRLTGCQLRCRYCDTEYAFYQGRRMTIPQILEAINRLVDEAADHSRLVQITGGEPLLQPHVHDLMTRLCDDKWVVLLETSGACDISICDSRVQRIVDFKTPGSGHVDDNLWSNIAFLARQDQVKFVICSRMDYEWARDIVQHHQLCHKVSAVLFSPVMEVGDGRELPGMQAASYSDLASWILADKLPVRFQLQLHKLIWGVEVRGV